MVCMDIERNRNALDRLMRWEFQENRTLESRPGAEIKWVQFGMSRGFIIARMKGSSRQYKLKYGKLSGNGMKSV